MESKPHKKLVPLLSTNAVLMIPNMGISPKLEEIQQNISLVADYILQVALGVSRWSQERGKVCGKLMTSFNRVFNRMRILMMI